MIGGKAPSAYLAAIQSHKQVGLDNVGMDALLASHRIAPTHLRSDDFQLFYQRRQDDLLGSVDTTGLCCEE
jgi:hypothetical protein